MVVKCPSCRAFLDDSDNFSVGEIVYCTECDADFEVMRLNPVRFRSLSSSNSDRVEFSDEDLND
ncbi:MAG: lysine biosynthesis protein LysW [Candidatus Omnitrophica bacterium]|nr:lysine biosynthesis protein LysW [Candidatus Omnitrophota bacterium]